MFINKMMMEIIHSVNGVLIVGKHGMESPTQIHTMHGILPMHALKCLAQ